MKDSTLGQTTNTTTTTIWSQQIPKRLVVIGLCCLGMVVVHAFRLNFTVTMISIADRNSPTGNKTMTITNAPDVSWNTVHIGYLRSTFYLGLLFYLIPGGYMATKFPANVLFGSCILVSSVLNLLLLVTISTNHYYSTCALRFVQGVSEGLLFPSSYAILWHWTPSRETSRLGALVLTGVYLGALVGLPVSTSITATYGWEFVYYAYGITAFIWLIAWATFSYDRPEIHPNISAQECQLLDEASDHSIAASERIPLKQIITSPQVLVLCLCSFAFYLIYTNELVYITIYGYQLDQTGLYASMPHLLMAITAFSSGFLADFFQHRSILTNTCMRKFFTCSGFAVEAISFLLLAFISNPKWAIVTLAIGVGSSGWTVAGWQINHLDLAPRYGSIIIGITNSFGALAGIISSVFVGYMTGDETITQWQKLFAIFSSLVWLAVILCAVFGSGDIQPWGEAPFTPVKKTCINMSADLSDPPYTPVTSQQMSSTPRFPTLTTPASTYFSDSSISDDDWPY